MRSCVFADAGFSVYLFLRRADRVQCLRIRPLDVLLQHTLVLEVYRLAAVPVFVDNVHVGGTDTNVFFKAVAADTADDRMTDPFMLPRTSSSSPIEPFALLSVSARNLKNGRERQQEADQNQPQRHRPPQAEGNFPPPPRQMERGPRHEPRDDSNAGFAGQRPGGRPPVQCVVRGRAHLGQQHAQAEHGHPDAGCDDRRQGRAVGFFKWNCCHDASYKTGAAL